MSMDYVRKTYGVPAKRGMHVNIYHRPCGWGRLPKDDPGRWALGFRGEILSADSHLYVRGMWNGKIVRRGPYHPTDGVVYFDREGCALLDTRDGAEW